VGWLYLLLRALSLDQDLIGPVDSQTPDPIGQTAFDIFSDYRKFSESTGGIARLSVTPGWW
jgi:hypothetical protein